MTIAHVPVIAQIDFAAVARTDRSRSLTGRFVLYRLEGMRSQAKIEAEKDAAKLLEATWGGMIPVDPVAIARTAGLRVLDAELDENTLGALVKQPGEDPTILLNQKDSENAGVLPARTSLGTLSVAQKKPRWG